MGKEKLTMQPEYVQWLRLRFTVDIIANAIDAEVEKGGLTRAQAAIIFVVKTSQRPATPSEIARHLYRKPHTVKMALERMERDGFITKANDLPRKNQIRIILTDKGEDTFNQLKKNTSIQDIMSVVSSADHDKLTSLLEALSGKANEVLQEIQGDRGFFPSFRQLFPGQR